MAYEKGKIRTDSGLFLDKGNFLVDPRHDDMDGGAQGDGVKNDYAAIVAADAFAQTLDCGLGFGPGTYLVSSSLTITSPCRFARGAKLKPASGVTITLQGDLKAGLFQVFDLSAGGVVRFGNLRPVPYISPEWFKHSTDTDDTESIERAIAAADTNLGATIVFRGQQYTFGDVEIARDSLRFVGMHRGGTWLSRASGASALFSVAGASDDWRSFLHFEDLRFLGGSGGVCFDIEFLENSIFKDIYLYQFTTGFSCNGFRLSDVRDVICYNCGTFFAGATTQLDFLLFENVVVSDTVSPREAFDIDIGISKSRFRNVIITNATVSVVPSGGELYDLDFENVTIEDLTENLDAFDLTADGATGTSRDVKIRNCRVTRTPRTGFKLSSVTDMVLDGNSAMDVGTQTTNTYDGFHLISCTGARIDNNIAADRQGSPTMRHGYYLQSCTACSFTKENLSVGHQTRYLNQNGFNSDCRCEIHGSAAPANGEWEVGDKVWNTAPAAAGNIGWVCTTAGAPGTWKTFGTIAS